MGAPPRPPGVVLVGFMGSGKSAVGRELAARLDLPFVDTDELIVAAAGPIERIFAARGEGGFRALEAETVLREVKGLGDSPKVLALGGGAVLAEEVRAALRRLGRVVWLAAPADVLWGRVNDAGGPARPLAQDREAFGALLAAREPLYREVATLTVQAIEGDPAGVASRIVRLLGGDAGDDPIGPGPREGAA